MATATGGRGAAVSDGRPAGELGVRLSRSARVHWRQEMLGSPVAPDSRHMSPLAASESRACPEVTGCPRVPTAAVRVPCATLQIPSGLGLSWEVLESRGGHRDTQCRQMSVPQQEVPASRSPRAAAPARRSQRKPERQRRPRTTQERHPASRGHPDDPDDPNDRRARPCPPQAGVLWGCCPTCGAPTPPGLRPSSGRDPCHLCPPPVSSLSSFSISRSSSQRGGEELEDLMFVPRTRPTVLARGGPGAGADTTVVAGSSLSWSLSGASLPVSHRGFSGNMGSPRLPCHRARRSLINH